MCGRNLIDLQFTVVCFLQNVNYDLTIKDKR